MKISLLFVGLIGVSSMTTLANAADNGPPAGLEAAMKECFSSASKDANGRPDHAAVDACMKGKGFSPPPGGPGGRPPHGHGRPDGPPPNQNQDSGSSDSSSSNSN